MITGTGWCTPLGDDVETGWKALLAGRSGVGPISRFHARTFPTNFAAETPDPDLGLFFADPSPFDKATVHTRFALAAASRAWKQAGLGDASDPRAKMASLNRRRLGVYLGAGEGPPDVPAFIGSNLAAWNDETRSVDMRRWAAEAYERMDAIGEVEQEPNMPLRHIAETFNAGGPTYNCLTACAASTQAIGEAAEVIRRRDADVMIAGGAHTMIHPLGVTGFIRLTALSSRRDEPQNACRPFSIDREGFVMGEGAGMLVLESLDHALARGATPLAEVAGFGSSADAFRITDIQPEGKGAQAAMLEALSQAGIDPAARGEDGRPLVHYISAHGTGTKENDSIESKAIGAVFKDAAKEVPVSSIKSMMGHLIAAAGAVEAITCVQAIRTGWVPPTRNLKRPDPACDLDYVPNEARDLNGKGGVRAALSNSFGFGGQNNALLIKAFEA
ncbi:MAG: beta-ketoacyl-[acyl-carrier-protein] synthase family protein [Planctomycetota bacterium]|nr:beta-ketoacyl-[acyl-carrier-protein] synthase family protein [Planctomycetota bacterium]